METVESEALKLMAGSVRLVSGADNLRLFTWFMMELDVLAIVLIVCNHPSW